MKVDSYHQLHDDAKVWERYRTQRVNDLLEQIEKLKAIDTSIDPERQIKVSLAVKSLHMALDSLL